jgi:hypothetical protein
MDFRYSVSGGCAPFQQICSTYVPGLWQIR